MSATRRGSANSNSSSPADDGERMTAGRGSERRSPHRPKFSKGWRKTIEHERAPTESEVADESDHVDIWAAQPEALLRAHSCLKLLTDEDWFSLQQIHDAGIRQSATAARILLRLGLAKSVDRKVAPSDWRFERSEHGKPTVSKGLPPIHFSVAHVDEISIVAVSRRLGIGVDVESIDQDVSESVMVGFYHAEEQDSVRDLQPRQKVRELLRFWTLKEAYTKMIGVGHSLDFDTIKFVLDPLALASEVGGAHMKRPTRFESLYIPVGHGLYHVSLAIEQPQQCAASTEVQIISLANPKGIGHRARTRGIA